MKDEMKMCQCGTEHPWGIVSYSKDHVPLYGPRAIPSCDNFVYAGGADVPGYTREIWEKTQDLNPQATAATRMAVAQLRSVGTDLGKYQQMTAQWPHFMGFVISQITDIRGALVRDESKFANLIGHTDEIVEAMRGVAQLSEQLKLQNLLSQEILERLEKLEHDREADKMDALLRKSEAATKPDEALLVKDDDDNGDQDDGNGEELPEHPAPEPEEPAEHKG